jgi:hypothetical protein
LLLAYMYMKYEYVCFYRRELHFISKSFFQATLQQIRSALLQRDFFIVCRNSTHTQFVQSHITSAKITKQIKITARALEFYENNCAFF